MIYTPGEYNLARFAVDAVHRNCILLQSVEVGDILLRLHRSRVQSNGFRLVQKLLEKEELFCIHTFPWHYSSASIFCVVDAEKNIFEVLPTSFKEIISQGYGEHELIAIFSSFTTSITSITKTIQKKMD
jgi:phosphoribosylaminoimidazole (AIR) synthetase